MVFAPYSRIDNETELLLDSVPQPAEPTTHRDRSQSSPPRPSFRPANRSRAISEPYFAPQHTEWHSLGEGDEDIENMDQDDQEDLIVSRSSLLRKKSSGFGLFKQGVLKAVGIKS
jgi:hypothetical protein